MTTAKPNTAIEKSNGQRRCRRLRLISLASTTTMMTPPAAMIRSGRSHSQRTVAVAMTE